MSVYILTHFYIELLVFLLLSRKSSSHFSRYKSLIKYPSKVFMPLKHESIIIILIEYPLWVKPCSGSYIWIISFDIPENPKAWIVLSSVYIAEA